MSRNVDKAVERGMWSEGSAINHITDEEMDVSMGQVGKYLHRR